MAVPCDDAGLYRRYGSIPYFLRCCWYGPLSWLSHMHQGKAEASDGSQQLAKRSWGGWDERPQTQQCYKQERTATLLALYLGVFGADHWYARHWILAAVKLITLGGFGIWAIVDVTLWIVGGVYGTPGCPGGNKKSWIS
jgi:hypothetical protein